MNTVNKIYSIYALTIEGDLNTTRYIGVTS